MAKNVSTPKRNIATRFFKDAGTGKSFEEGKPVNVDAATLANYEAAGLVGAPSEAQQLADEANVTA